MIVQDKVAVKLPNFLIVGQAKCGTSSLSEYLRQHSEVFISANKEPRFLSSQHMNGPLGGPKDDTVEEWYVKDFEGYAVLILFISMSTPFQPSGNILEIPKF
jgi:hypothetical protein